MLEGFSFAGYFCLFFLVVTLHVSI
jgi:hypothetical protein